MGEILNIDHLSVAIDTPRGQVRAVRDVSFSLAQGETLAIVGESGCGKSILCKSIQRLLPSGGRITGGHIFFRGEDLTEKSERAMTRLRRSAFSMVFQDPMTALNPTMTVGSQIAEAVRLHHGRLPKAEVSRRVLELMDRVGIPEPVLRQHQYPHHFSGGQRQRLVLAMALAGEPAVLFADEPTTALDVTIQAQILELIKAMQKKYNLTTIYITHDLGVVANVADRIAVMYAGDIIEVGRCDEVFYDPKHPYTWALLSSLPQLGVKGEDLYAIQGTPPNLFYEVHGDAFAPRNPKALKIDFVKRPPFFEVSQTHKARTWLLDPRAPKVDPPEHIRALREKGVKSIG